MELSNGSNTFLAYSCRRYSLCGLNDDKVLALSAGNGEVLWSYQTGGAVYSSPAIADNVVYFGSWDNSVYALNALTGVQVIYGIGIAAVVVAIVVGAIYLGKNNKRDKAGQSLIDLVAFFRNGWSLVIY